MATVKSCNMHCGRSCLLDKGVWQETALTCLHALSTSGIPGVFFPPVIIANKDGKDGWLEGRPWKREVNRFLPRIQTLSP